MRDPSGALGATLIITGTVLAVAPGWIDTHTSPPLTAIDDAPSRFVPNKKPDAVVPGVNAHGETPCSSGRAFDVTVNVLKSEVLEGVTTVTPSSVLADSNDDGISVVIWPAFTNFVVRSVPLILTIEFTSKPLPVKVSVVAEAPAGTLLGVMSSSTGPDIEESMRTQQKGLLCPYELVNVTSLAPSAAATPADIVRTALVDDTALTVALTSAPLIAAETVP
jgi:hypothetical protein